MKVSLEVYLRSINRLSLSNGLFWGIKRKKVVILIMKAWFVCLQGLRIVFNDAARLVFRMSGSGGGMGATIRIYAESFERDPERHSRETQVERECDSVSVCICVCVCVSNGVLSFLQCYDLKYCSLIQSEPDTQHSASLVPR